MQLCIMSVDKSKTVLIFKHKKIAFEIQERAGRRHYDGREPQPLNLGKLRKLAIDVARAAREGDEVWLWALPMIAVDRKSAGASHHAQITLFCKEVRGNRATLVEGSTGRTSESRSQASAMIEEAHKIVTQGGKRLPKRNVPAGRKPKRWPSLEVGAAAKRLWKSKNIESDAAAIREAMEAWPDVTERMMRNLGKSGRNG